MADQAPGQRLHGRLASRFFVIGLRARGPVAVEFEGDAQQAEVIEVSRVAGDAGAAELRKLAKAGATLVKAAKPA